MHEETEFRPKPMVLVGGRPILWHVMKLYSHFGYNDFVLCLGYKGEAIKQYFLNIDELTHDFTLHLGSGKKEIFHHQNETPHWNITFADTGLDTETGGRIARIQKYIGDDEDFFLTYGDGVADVTIPQLYRYHKEKGKIVTVTAVRPKNPFGVIEIETGLARSFSEKPQSEDWTSGGFFVCNRKVFDYITPDAHCVFEQTPLRMLAREGQFAAYHHHNFWHCVDTLKDVKGLAYHFEHGNRPWMLWEIN
jgi:glucose-1-phosphate cytidylyltransferase